MTTSPYETETKPALRALTATCLGPDAPAPLTEIKAAVDAASKAGATPREIADAVGGQHAWNALVRTLRAEGVI